MPEFPLLSDLMQTIALSQECITFISSFAGFISFSLVDRLKPVSYFNKESLSI